MDTAQQIIKTIRSNPRIPAPSQTVHRILELTRDPNCDMKKIAGAISHDGGLTAQLLRQANSALFSFPSPTSSVCEACMRLGLKRVRSAVINQHVVNGLGRARPPGFDAHRYWQSALAISVAARDLAEQLASQSAEEACTAGLLCDIGIGLLAFGVPDLYQPVLARQKRSASLPLHVIEAEILGLTHGQVGAAVLTEWKLAPDIILAVRDHHAEASELASPETPALARIIAAATTLSGIALDGAEMDQVERLFVQMEGLTEDADNLVTRLLEDLVTRIQQTADSLSVELGAVEGMAENLQELARGLPDVGANMSFRPMSRDAFGG